MALGLVPVGEVTLSFVDRNGRVGKTSYNFLASNTIADAQSAAEAVGAAVQAASGAALQAINITYKVTDPTITPSSAAADSDIFRKMSISFEGATPNLKSRMEVPSPLQSFFPLGSEYADPAVGAVATLIAEVLNPTLGSGTGPVTASGADLVKQVGRVKEIGRRNT
jgi:hypothetical protein